MKETYGDNQASVILSESGTIAFLRQTGDSAKAAAEFLGKQILVITNRSSGSSGGGEQGISFQAGQQEQQVERWTVEPEAFSTTIQLAGKANGVGGFFFSPSVCDVWFHRFEWRELHRLATIGSDDHAHEAKKPREGIAYQFLKKWTDAERLKFGLRVKTPEKEKEQGAQREQPPLPQGAQMMQEEEAVQMPAVNVAFDLGEYTQALKEKSEPIARERILAAIQAAERKP